MRTKKVKKAVRRPSEMKNFKYSYDDDDNIARSVINKKRAKRLDRALKKNNAEQIMEYMD